MIPFCFNVSVYLFLVVQSTCSPVSQCAQSRLGQPEHTTSQCSYTPPARTCPTGTVAHGSSHARSPPIYGQQISVSQRHLENVNVHVQGSPLVGNTGVCVWRLTLHFRPARSCIFLGSSFRSASGSRSLGPDVCQRNYAARKGSPGGERGKHQCEHGRHSN